MLKRTSNNETNLRHAGTEIANVGKRKLDEAVKSGISHGLDMLLGCPLSEPLMGFKQPCSFGASNHDAPEQWGSQECLGTTIHHPSSHREQLPIQLDREQYNVGNSVRLRSYFWT